MNCGAVGVYKLGAIPGAGWADYRGLRALAVHYFEGADCLLLHEGSGGGNGDGGDPGVRGVCRRGWRLPLGVGLVSVTLAAELLGQESIETMSRRLLGYSV